MNVILRNTALAVQIQNCYFATIQFLAYETVSFESRTTVSEITVSEINMLYERLAEALRTQISQGVYPTGGRLHSVREQSRLHSVSQSTVVLAYQQLEAEGLIEARPQSGFYVRERSTNRSCPETTLPKPRTRPLSVNVGQHIMQVVDACRDPQLIHFSTASPSADLLPVASFNRALTQAMRNDPTHFARYESRLGNPLLRQHIARLSLEAGIEVSSDDIIVTNGCQEALSLALRAVANSGDVIAVESPTYYGILQAIERYGMKVLEIPTHARDGISIEALRFAMDQWPIKAVVAMPTYSNPIGSTMPESNKQALMQLLNERDVALIEDDVHAEFCGVNQRPKAVKHYDTQARVLLCSSFSKTIAPGLRVGWILPGSHYFDRVAQLKYITTLATAGLQQAALAEFLSHGAYSRHVKQLKRTYRTQQQRMSEAIAHYFPVGTKAAIPDGGTVSWIELPNKISSWKLFELALQHGISIVPGSLFSTQKKYEHFIRLCWGGAWTARTEQALRKLGQLIEQLQHNP